MIELVLWSGALALTPWALGLAWKLISGVAGLIGPAAPTEIASSNQHDIDVEQPAACQRLLRRRESDDPEWVDIDRHRSGEARRRVCPRAG
jgi:hypothetical protein